MSIPLIMKVKVEDGLICVHFTEKRGVDEKRAQLSFDLVAA